VGQGGGGGVGENCLDEDDGRDEDGWCDDGAMAGGPTTAGSPIIKDDGRIVMSLVDVKLQVQPTLDD